jgi:hypothetical protein
VSRRIEQITRGTFVVQPGSLFPALHRLEGSRLAGRGLAAFREQPAGEVLHAHQGRTPSAGRGSRAVESRGARHLARAGGMT